ncbi:MAG: PilZ domain-containing protein [Acidobacteria bacterium]|nr:PilZ domain-containing protein [Acidobacteriota bacterium]
MITERRRYKRYLVSGRILFQAQSVETFGELVDIGKWGVYIRTEAKPLQGEEITAHLEAQDYPGAFEVKGMVVRILSDSCAIAFLEWPVKLVTLLQFLDERDEEEIQEHGEKEPEEKNLQLKAERDPSHAQREEAEARARRLEEDLTQAKQALQDQSERADRLIRLLKTERDQSWIQLSFAQKLQETLKQEKQQAEARATSLEQELRQEKKAAEALARQLKAEQDERRAQLSSFESHLQNLEEQLALAQKQFQNQREAVTRMLQQRTANKEESQ